MQLTSQMVSSTTTAKFDNCAPVVQEVGVKVNVLGIRQVNRTNREYEEWYRENGCFEEERV